MLKNQLLEQVNKIEELEIQLTVFNSKRALSKVDKKLEIKKIGNCRLLYDQNGTTNSIYYNRIKGFGMKDLNKLEQILNVYNEQNINPCFDMTPNNINEKVSTELLKYGYAFFDQLVFMQSIPKSYGDFKKDINIVEVTQENAEEFVNIIVKSNGGMAIDETVIEKKKQYFYEPNFHNYIAYIEGEVAGLGSLFTNCKEGYICNDYTFEKFRGNGIQKTLLKYRINKAKEMGLDKLYTDVEFGSVSHNNMEKLCFQTVFMNSFYKKLM